MAKLVPVDYDPFAPAPEASGGPKLVPVDYDPFAKPSTTNDVVQAAGSGLAKGAVSRLGIVGDLHSIADAAAQVPGRAYNYMFGTGKFEPTEGMKRAREAADAKNIGAGKVLPDSGDVIRGAEGLMGQKFYEPQTTAGKYVDSAATFVGAGAKPTSAKSVALTGAAGASSEGAGQAAEKAGLSENMQTVARVAGALGPAVASRVITPNPINAERKALVDTLKKEGVPLTAGQKTGSKGLQYMESASETAPFGSGNAREIQEAQQRAFTGAAMKRMGEPGQMATPEVLQGAGDRFNTAYRDLSSRNTLNMDPQFGQDLGKAVRDYQGLVTGTQQAPIVQGIVGDLISKVVTNGGKIDGPMYQEMRSRLGKASANTGDNALKGALKDIRKALDDAMMRSITPADAAKWKQTNREYANWKAIQPAANAAGEGAAQGYLSPAVLRSSVARQNANAYSQGKGDLGELARAGTLLNPLPNSGTAQRMQSQLFPTAVIGGLASGDARIAAAALAPTALSHAVMNPILQKYMGNTRIPKGMISAEDKLRMLSGARTAPGLLGD